MSGGHLGAAGHLDQAPALVLRQRTGGYDVDPIPVLRLILGVVNEILLLRTHVLAVPAVLVRALDLDGDRLVGLGARNDTLQLAASARLMPHFSAIFSAETP